MTRTSYAFRRIVGFVSIALVIVWALVLARPSLSLAHGEGTRIVPAALSVKAGSELKVTVNGLVGTDTATFHLTGISGKYELGSFSIESDDFEQMLPIPSEVPPGTYRLTVEGGKKRAKVVITVN